MTTIEGAIGLVASVVAIIGALVITARYLAKRFDNWASAVVENSKAMRDLSTRVARLEGAMSKVNGN
jgi:hypothetical protein